MGKEGSKYPETNYTTADFIKYLGELPECIDDTCERPFNRKLSNILKLLLEKYCDDTAALETDISSVDIECLIEANPDIVMGEDLTLFDLLTYFKEHLCYIYERLCPDCNGGGETSCAFDLFCDTPYITFTFSGLPQVYESTGITLIIGGNILVPINFDDAYPGTLVGFIDAIQSAFISSPVPNFTFTRTNNSFTLTYTGEEDSECTTISLATNSFRLAGDLSPRGYINFVDTATVTTNGIVSNESLDNGGYSANIKFLTCKEYAASPCELLEDHEERLLRIENECPFDFSLLLNLITFMTIPVYRVLDIEKTNTVVIKLEQHVKNSQVYALSNNNTTVATNPVITDSFNGTYVIDQNLKTLTYESVNHLNNEDFDIYVHDTAGVVLPLNIVITKITTCCGDPIVCEDETYRLSFNTNVWGNISPITVEELENDIITVGAFLSGTVVSNEVYYPLPPGKIWTLQRVDCNTNENVGSGGPIQGTGNNIEITVMPGDPSIPAIKIPLSFTDFTYTDEEEPLCIDIIGICEEILT